MVSVVNACWLMRRYEMIRLVVSGVDGCIEDALHECMRCVFSFHPLLEGSWNSSILESSISSIIYNLQLRFLPRATIVSANCPSTTVMAVNSTSTWHQSQTEPIIVDVMAKLITSKYLKYAHKSNQLTPHLLATGAPEHPYPSTLTFYPTQNFTKLQQP